MILKSPLIRMSLHMTKFNATYSIVVDVTQFLLRDDAGVNLCVELTKARGYVACVLYFLNDTYVC